MGKKIVGQLYGKKVIETPYNNEIKDGEIRISKQELIKLCARINGEVNTITDKGTQYNLDLAKEAIKNILFLIADYPVYYISIYKFNFGGGVNYHNAYSGRRILRRNPNDPNKLQYQVGPKLCGSKEFPNTKIEYLTNTISFGINNPIMYGDEELSRGRIDDDEMGEDIQKGNVKSINILNNIVTKIAETSTIDYNILGQTFTFVDLDVHTPEWRDFDLDNLVINEA